MRGVVALKEGWLVKKGEGGLLQGSNDAELASPSVSEIAKSKEAFDLVGDLSLERETIWSVEDPGRRKEERGGRKGREEAEGRRVRAQPRSSPPRLILASLPVRSLGVGLYEYGGLLL